MAIERIDQLTGSVEIGRTYLVPMVVGLWPTFSARPRAYPVIGPEHNDAQCLDFDYRHYHLDARFMPTDRSYDAYPNFWRYVFSTPLVSDNNGLRDNLPAPEWRPRRCRRLINPAAPHVVAKHNLLKTKPWRCHFDQWAGKQARHDGRGWVCPHRNVPLADHPVVGNVITCPLHLLKIDATTGRVLPQPAEAA